jgi:hypothetical protein
VCQDVSPPHHPCCYYHFGNQVCPVHAHFPPSQPEWRKQLRGGGGLGGGKLAAAAGRRVARWPAACTCCRKNNTVLCFPQTLSARLRSVVIPPSSGCAGRGGAGRLCRCDPPEMCLELRTRWMAVLPPPPPRRGTSSSVVAVSAAWFRISRPQLHHSVSHSADCSCVGDEETEPRQTRFLPSWWVLVGFSIQY